MTTPAQLPNLRIQVTEAGEHEVTLDGQGYLPGIEHRPPGPETTRRIIDAVHADLGTIRVQVIEADGSVYTDILVAQEPTTATTAPSPSRAYATGFFPGEPVALAVIVDERPASEKGTAEVRLPAAVLAGLRGTVMLLGRTSGTLTFVGPDR